MIPAASGLPTYEDVKRYVAIADTFSNCVPPVYRPIEGASDAQNEALLEDVMARAKEANLLVSPERGYPLFFSNLFPILYPGQRWESMVAAMNLPPEVPPPTWPVIAFEKVFRVIFAPLFSSERRWRRFLHFHFGTLLVEGQDPSSVDFQRVVWIAMSRRGLPEVRMSLYQFLAEYILVMLKQIQDVYAERAERKPPKKVRKLLLLQKFVRDFENDLNLSKIGISALNDAIVDNPQEYRMKDVRVLQEERGQLAPVVLYVYGTLRRKAIVDGIDSKFSWETHITNPMMAHRMIKAVFRDMYQLIESAIKTHSGPPLPVTREQYGELVRIEQFFQNSATQNIRDIYYARDMPMDPTISVTFDGIPEYDTFDRMYGRYNVDYDKPREFRERKNQQQSTRGQTLSRKFEDDEIADREKAMREQYAEDSEELFANMTDDEDSVNQDSASEDPRKVPSDDDNGVLELFSHSSSEEDDGYAYQGEGQVTSAPRYKRLKRDGSNNVGTCIQCGKKDVPLRLLHAEVQHQRVPLCNDVCRLNYWNGFEMLNVL